MRWHARAEPAARRHSRRGDAAQLDGRADARRVQRALRHLERLEREAERRRWAAPCCGPCGRWTCRAAAASVVALAALVILRPQSLLTGDALRFEAVTRELADVTRHVALADTELSKFKRRAPWLGAPSVQLQEKISRADERLAFLRVARASLQAEKAALVVAQRPITPVFSQLAFEEARDLWWQLRQHHMVISLEVWKWSMIFEFLFAGIELPRDDSLKALLLVAALRLAWRLSGAAFVAAFDFAARLPSCLREYDRFDYDEAAAAAAAAAAQGDGGVTWGNASAALAHTCELAPLDRAPALSEAALWRRARDDAAVLGGNGWFSARTASLVAAWVVLVCGAAGASLLAVAVLFTPLAVLVAGTVRWHPWLRGD